MVFRPTIIASAALVIAAASFGLSADVARAQDSKQFPSETYESDRFPNETYSGDARFPDDRWDEQGVGIDPGRFEQQGVGINPGRSDRKGVGINPGRFDR